jgi:hypothetical protein
LGFRVELFEAGHWHGFSFSFSMQAADVIGEAVLANPAFCSNLKSHFKTFSSGLQPRRARNAILPVC